MNTESFRELRVLEELSANSSPTQRHLSRKLGVALGLTNSVVRRCVKKGYLTAVSLQRNRRLQYLLTPGGIAEKTRLTYEYLEYSLFLYRTVRRVLKEVFLRVARTGGRQVVFLGTGEVAEVAYLSLQEAGLNLLAVIDDQAAGERFLGMPVGSLRDLSTVPFDCAIVCSLREGLERYAGRLRELGVPEGKVVFLEQRGAEVAVSPWAGMER